MKKRAGQQTTNHHLLGVKWIDTLSHEKQPPLDRGKVGRVFVMGEPQKGV